MSESLSSITGGTLHDVSIITKSGDSFTKLGLNYVDIFFLFIKLYGPVIILGCFSIIGFYIILKRLYSQNIKTVIFQDKYYFFILLFYCIFFLICIFAVFDSIRPINIGGHRFLYLVYTLIPLPAATGISLLFLETKQNDGVRLPKFSKFVNIITIKYGFIICTLIICFSIEFLTFFYSPLIYQPNSANTIQEISGADWVLHNGDKNYNIMWEGKSVSLPRRYSNLLVGTNSEYEYPYGDPSLTDDEFAHFRYYKFSKLGDSIEREKYLILRENITILIYKQFYPLLARFNHNDFVLFFNDNSVNLIYSNSEMKTYLVSKNWNFSQ
jgi:hypothetical protein